MADQGRWLKLWVSALSDPDLDNLSLEDFARWCKLGLYVKLHGTEGSLRIPPPADGLCFALKVDGYSALRELLERLPGYNVTGVTNAIVSCPNWLKYQGDFSRDRVAKFRDRVTAKKRREETRGEESSERVSDVSIEDRSPSMISPAGGASGDLPDPPPDVTDKSVTKSNNHRGPISQVASQAQALRLKLLDERHKTMPQRDGFKVWPAAQRLYSQGLPLDTATSILNAMVSRWETILHPWAYLQKVLDAEHREYHIRIQEAEHDKTKKLPANVDLIGEVMRRAAGEVTADTGEKPDAEPWT